ncbi:DUF2138 family protein [Bordetella sp. FB-8]|uniref:DUF2138 family protein n=1 Tax=Bordetella sp. FB-8 TaxID=1159870 RepID=UPI0003638030|nr:DUF2138 family protein [Bordetella sp. FB-8]
MNRAHKVAGLAFLVAAAISLLIIQALWRPFEFHHAPEKPQVYDVHIDIDRPDAIIDSAALSRLPRDIIQVPLLQSLLTQDFVDYYETHPTRLSAEGALRRLAFEHNLDWRDSIIRQIFDEPARVLLWRSPDRRLGRWMISMRRNGIAKLAQAIGNVAASDSQLSRIARLPDGTAVYAIHLATDHTLIYAAKGDRLVIMSEPGMLLDNANEPIRARVKTVMRMLDGDADQALRSYGLDHVPPVGNGHRLVVSVNYLSFGYQAFFTGIDALRFDFAPAANGGQSTWSTWALIAPGRLPQGWNSADLWHALPADPAACASLPVDWTDATKLLAQLGAAGKQAAPVLSKAFSGPAAVCWYAKSSLVSPVFVARLSPGAQRDPKQLDALRQALGAELFAQVIGAYEAKADSREDYSRLPVQATHDDAAGVWSWMRPVSAVAGTAVSADAPFARQLSTPRYFPVTLALTPRYAIFSPDARLVNETLAVLGKRYPALADTIAPARLAGTVAVIAPSAAAAMAEREITLALPPDQEPIFRNAARTYLFPKLHAFARYPPLTLSLPDAPLPSRAGWVKVDWHTENGK